MTWFAFQGYNNGKAINLAGTQEKQAVVTGFHGYGTEAQAEKQPNSVNIFQKLEVNGLIADYNAALKTQSQPGGKNASNPVGQVQQGLTNTAKNALNATGLGSAITSVEGFLSAFGDKNLWIRATKIVVGSSILIVGIAKLTGAEKEARKLGTAALKATPAGWIGAATHGKSH